MSNQSAGGRMILTLGDGRRVKIKGDFKIDPSSTGVTTEKNLDGSFTRIISPRNYKADMTLELPPGVTADDLLAFEGNLTVEEAHTGRTHLFTDGCFVGEPSTDQKNLSTSGLSFESVDYRMI
jgi:hypothetical protein